MAIAPDGTWLVTGDGESVRIRDAANGQERAVLHGRYGPIRVSVVI